MMHKSIFKQLSLKAIIPIVIVVFISLLANFIFFTQSYKSNRLSKIQSISNQVKSLVNFQNVSLENLSKSIEEQHEKYANVLIRNFVSNTDSLVLMDLYAVRNLLTMTQNYDDISIINANGIIVNTTFKPDYLVNVYTAVKNSEEFYTKILTSKSFTIQHLIFDRFSRRFRKNSFIATPDQKFIFKISSFLPAFDGILKRMNSTLTDLSKIDMSIKNIEIFIDPDDPYSISFNNEFKKKNTTTLKNMFRNKISSLEVEAENDISNHYFYISEPANIFSTYIIKITIDYSIEKKQLRNKYFLLVGIFIIICFLTISYIIFTLRKSLHLPILKVLEQVKIISKGDLQSSQKIKIEGTDEINQISDAINTLTDQLVNMANFSREIGSGNFEAEIAISSEYDQVGRSLLEMRQNLKRMEEEKHQRDIVDDRLSWISNGLTHFNMIMRQHNNDIEKLSKNIIGNIVKYTKATQGGLFVINDLNTKDIYIELAAAYAFDQNRYLKHRVELNEGYVGACVQEKYTIYRTEIPADYFEIESGLGYAAPKAIIFVPLKLNDDIFGVIELASFQNFEPFEIEFLEKLAESISYTLSAIKNNDKNEALLEQTQKQSLRFSIQESQMKQKLEDISSKLASSQNNEALLKGEIETMNRKLKVAALKIKELRNRRTSFEKIQD